MFKRLLPFILFFAGSATFAQTFSHQQAIDDIDFYVRVMKESHYNPFMYISPKDYDKQIQEIKQSIGDSISAKEFIFLFYQVTALLEDAHSTPQISQPLLQDELRKEQFFPYKLVQEKNKLYAPLQLATDLGIPVGAELVEINGKNFSVLFQQTESRIAGIATFRQDAGCKLLSYFLFLQGITPPFTLGYTNANGVMQKAVIKTGVSFKTALSASLPHIIKPYTSEILQGKLGYIDVRTLSANRRSFNAFLDTCFATFKQANIRNVAIDLRKNSGGNTLLADLLFSYITNKKYAWGIKEWKISDVYKQYIKENGDTTSSYLQRKSGSIWVSDDGCEPQPNRFKNDTLFEGNVFFITGPFTFSSAMAAADVVKEYKLGTIVGEPTGENVMDFGEAFTITLPNSKIKIQSTTSLSRGVNCSRKKNGPVQPDIIVRNTLQDEVTGRDAILAYLLKKAQ